MNMIVLIMLVAQIATGIEGVKVLVNIPEGKFGYDWYGTQSVSYQRVILNVILSGLLRPLGPKRFYKILRIIDYYRDI